MWLNIFRKFHASFSETVSFVSSCQNSWFCFILSPNLPSEFRSVSLICCNWKWFSCFENFLTWLSPATEEGNLRLSVRIPLQKISAISSEKICDNALSAVQQASLTGGPMASGKPHFVPDLGLFGPNLGYKFFFEVSALLDVRHCPKLQYFAISRQPNDAN